jgi:hypothetical protein
MSSTAHSFWRASTSARVRIPRGEKGMFAAYETTISRRLVRKSRTLRREAATVCIRRVARGGQACQPG